MGPKQPIAGPSRIKATSTQAPPPPASVAAFNPSRTLFACAQPVLGSADKLTIWDVIADRVIAEWEVEGAAKATTVAWSSISSGAARKKRRKRSNAADGEEDVVVLTTDKGSLIVYTPRRGEVLRRLDVGKVTASASDDRLVLVTAKEVLVINHDLSAVEFRFGHASASTAAALLPTSTAEVLHLLVAHASVTVLHLDLTSQKISHTSSPLPVSTSSVLSILPIPSAQGTSFLVVCEDDRAISQYTLPSPTAAAKLSYRYASPTLSPVHSTSISTNLVSALHSSGEVSLFAIPKELDFARPKSDSKPSVLKLVEGKEDRLVRLAGVSFVDEEDAPGSLVCGRMVGGGRVKWVKAVYELPEGGVKSETTVKCDAQDLVGAAASQNVSCDRFAPADPSLYPFSDTLHPQPPSRSRSKKKLLQLFQPMSIRPTFLSASDCWPCPTGRQHRRKPLQSLTGPSTLHPLHDCSFKLCIPLIRHCSTCVSLTEILLLSEILSAKCLLNLPSLC